MKPIIGIIVTIIIRIMITYWTFLRVDVGNRSAMMEMQWKSLALRA